MSRTPSPRKPRGGRTLPGQVSATRGASWMALVAAATLGIPSVQRVRAAVSGEHPELGGREPYRLIVQSYTARSVVDGVLDVRARPLASAQRSVTSAELARGIAIDVVGLGEQSDTSPVIVAWVERGVPDLAFDALRARPSRDAYIGVAAIESGIGDPQARVVLNRRLG